MTDLSQSMPEPVSAPPRFLRQAATIVAFNAVIAAGLTYVAHFGGNLAQNMVYSQCIGLCIFLIVHTVRVRLWPNRSPRLAPFLLLLATGMAGGYFIGTTLAGLLLGNPTNLARAGINPLAVMIITISASSIVTWWLWTSHRMAAVEAAAARLRADAEAAQRQAVEAQLQLLQAQIEPHFLFNTLANLRSLISLDPPRALAMLDRLNDYLRATLVLTRTGLATLGEEFALLEAYLELLRMRMGGRLEYSLALPPQLQSLPMPPMLLQPLVENAVKHGLEPKIEGGRVDVSAALTDGVLVIRVADTGLGLTGTGAGGAQVGLRNVRERIRGGFGPAATFELRAAPGGGALSELRLPLPQAHTAP